jgi:hypothetical protein
LKTGLPQPGTPQLAVGSPDAMQLFRGRQPPWSVPCETGHTRACAAPARFVAHENVRHAQPPDMCVAGVLACHVFFVEGDGGRGRPPSTNLDPPRAAVHQAVAHENVRHSQPPDMCVAGVLACHVFFVEGDGGRGRPPSTNLYPPQAMGHQNRGAWERTPRTEPFDRLRVKSVFATTG